MSKYVSRRILGVAAIGLLMMGAAPSPAPPPVTVTGAGSTFVNPVLSNWAADYMANARVSGGAKIVYQSVGSGAGIELIKARKVDFGASDKPLSPEELAKSGLGQFPVVIGGVVPVVNIPGVETGQIKFTGPLLADIFLGKVTHWNDPEIIALNPKLALPSAPITVVHRSDGSGTTFNWVNYLGKVSAAWQSKVGEGTTVNWPVGVGAKGNDGVAAAVKATPNAIGYVELTYVEPNHLTAGLVRNKAGRFVSASAESFQAAAEDVDWSPANDFNTLLTDAPGEKAYPIAASTFILAHKKPAVHAQNTAMLHLFQWALYEGQSDAAALGYVPLPKKLVLKIQTYWVREFAY